MGIRATYTQGTTQGVTDLLEIHDADFTGDAIELQASDVGFKHTHREIAGERDGFLNPYNSRIMEGVLDFYPKIESSSEKTLFDDILGADPLRFKIVWKQDGNIEWQGYIDNRSRSYPERDTHYFGHLRARDFEILKGVFYTSDGNIDGSLLTGRAKIIEILAEQLAFLDFGIDIKTVTSWAISGTTGDYLNNAEKDKYAFRTFARTGDESDEPISVYESLLWNLDGLIISQKGGTFWVEQITEYEDAGLTGSTTNLFTYNSSGVLQTSETINAGQQAYTSKDSGTPWISRLQLRQVQ